MAGRTSAEIRADLTKIKKLIKMEDDDSVLYGIHIALMWVVGESTVAPSVIGERIYAQPSKPPVE